MYQSDPEQPWRGVSPAGERCARGPAERRNHDGPWPTKPPGRVGCSCRRRWTARIRRYRHAQGRHPIAARARSPWSKARLAAGRRTDRSKGHAAIGNRDGMGAAPGAPLIEQADLASREVYSACGIPLSVVTDAEGTGQREGYRRLMHSTIACHLGGSFRRGIEREVRDRYFTVIRVACSAADLAGRARAFQSLVGGGIDGKGRCLPGCCKG